MRGRGTAREAAYARDTLRLPVQALPVRGVREDGPSAREGQVRAEEGRCCGVRLILIVNYWMSRVACFLGLHDFQKTTVPFLWRCQQCHREYWRFLKG